MTAPRYDLTVGPVGLHMRRLAVAMGWGIVAMNTVQITDMWFVSRLGHDALTAMAFTLPVTGFLFYMVLAMSSGMTSASSRAMGAGRREHAARTVTAGIIASAVIGLCMSMIARLVSEHVFRAMGATEALLPLIARYMHIWYWALPFMAVCIVANSGARGAGEGALVAAVMVFLALVNLALSPLFIFWLGFGIEGSAMATLLAYIAAMLASLLLVGRRLHLLKIRTLRNRPKTWAALRRWAGVAAPVSLAYAIEPLSAGILTASVAGLGLDAVAAFGIGTQVEGIALVMLMALWGAVTPLAGQNWAAGRRHRVRRAIELGVIANAVFCLIFAIVMWAAGDRVAGWFSDAPQTLQLATLYLWLVPLSYAGFGAGGLVGSALNGIGRSHWYLMANLARIALMLALATLGARAYGFAGFALGISAANFIAGGTIMFWARGVFLAPPPASKVSPDQPTFP